MTAIKQLIFVSSLVLLLSCATETTTPPTQQETSSVPADTAKEEALLSECGDVIVDIGSLIYGVIYIIATPLIAAAEAVD